MRLIGYTRVSTDGQEFNTSLQGQSEELEAFCGRSSLRLISIEREVASGGDSNRPVLHSIFSRLAAGDADGLIVSKVDRYSRSVLDGLKWHDALKRDGKLLLFAALPELDLTKASGLFTLTLLLAVAQFERAQIAERTAAGKALKFLQDGYAGGRAAFGTIIEHGRKVASKAELSILDRIQELRNRGYTIEAIVRWLQHRKIPTKRGGSWSKSTVWQLLRRTTEKLINQKDQSNEKITNSQHGKQNSNTGPGQENRRPGPGQSPDRNA